MVELVLRNASVVHIPFFLKNSFGGKDIIPENTSFTAATDHPEFVGVDVNVHSENSGVLVLSPLVSHAEEFHVTLSASGYKDFIFNVRIVREKDAEPSMIALDMDNVSFASQTEPPEPVPPQSNPDYPQYNEKNDKKRRFLGWI